MSNRQIKNIFIYFCVSLSLIFANTNLFTFISKEIKLKYLIHLPQQYDESNIEKWPVILFLHGIGERGENLELVKKHGIPLITEQNKNFPFITISPQCPIENFWNDSTIQKAIMNMLNEVLSNYKTDSKRIYLTGLSMGGYGTWSLALKHPDVFAAAVPICGGGDSSKVEKIKDMPIWAFHGAKDLVVPAQESQNMVNALKKINGNVKYTLYPNLDHDSWTVTYNNPELYQWLLSHQK